jgi:hypothetical protein
VPKYTAAESSAAHSSYFSDQEHRHRDLVPAMISSAFKHLTKKKEEEYLNGLYKWSFSDVRVP